MENYPDLGQVSMNLFSVFKSMNLFSVFSSISPGLWQALMGFMYVQVAQQHRDIMREILGTRNKKVRNPNPQCVPEMEGFPNM